MLPCCQAKHILVLYDSVGAEYSMVLGINSVHILVLGEDLHLVHSAMVRLKYTELNTSLNTFRFTPYGMMSQMFNA